MYAHASLSGTVTWMADDLAPVPLCRYHRCIAVVRRALGLCDCGWGRCFRGAGNERRWDRTALVSPRHSGSRNRRVPPDRWFSVAEDNKACSCEGVRSLVKMLAICLAEFAYTCTDMRRPFDAEAMYVTLCRTRCRLGTWQRCA